MDPQLDLTYTLPADAQYHIIRSLPPILPPPPDPSPDAEARRNNAIIARVAALQPAGSAETELAAAFVACTELWRNAARLSNAPDLPLKDVLKCRAQAASMMRQAMSAIRELRHMQADRRKLEADCQACDRAARAEHLATVLMA